VKVKETALKALPDIQSRWRNIYLPKSFICGDCWQKT